MSGTAFRPRLDPPGVPRGYRGSGPLDGHAEVFDYEKFEAAKSDMVQCTMSVRSATTAEPYVRCDSILGECAFYFTCHPCCVTNPPVKYRGRG